MEKIKEKKEIKEITNKTNDTIQNGLKIRGILQHPKNQQNKNLESLKNQKQIDKNNI